jgi:hypothetical protein
MIKIDGIEYDRLKIDKDTHRYCRKAVKSDNKLYYDSVSSVLEKYKRPYNSKYWSLYKAYQGVIIDRLKNEFPSLSGLQLEKRSKAIMKENLYQYIIDNVDPYADPSENMDALNYAIGLSDITVEEIFAKKAQVLDSWDDKRIKASTKGNVYHRGRELKSIKTKEEFNSFDNKSYNLNIPVLVDSIPDYNPEDHSNEEEALQWYMDYCNEKWSISDDLYKDLPDGFYPELLIWDNDSLTAGTSDRVFIETILGERFVDIDDYKTNAKIDQKSFFVRGKGYQMMKPPVGHLMDCKHSHYHLQVSIYAYMLEKMGFTVRNVGYHHLNTFHNLPYLKSEAKNLLDDFNYNRDKEKNDLINKNKL